MSTTIHIDFPDSVIQGMQREPGALASDLRLAAAAKWYEAGRISQEFAAQVAGLSRAEFLLSLAQFNSRTDDRAATRENQESVSMKALWPILLLLASLSCPAAFQGGDTFDGTELDTTKWTANSGVSVANSDLISSGANGGWPAILNWTANTGNLRSDWDLTVQYTYLKT